MNMRRDAGIIGGPTLGTMDDDARSAAGVYSDSLLQPPRLERRVLPIALAEYHFADGPDRSGEDFALQQLRRHGTPYVLLVERDGRIRHADRRPGWRELVESVAPLHDMRLPDFLGRIVRRHAMSPPAGDAASVAVAHRDIVVSVVSLDARDELFAVSVWRIHRENVLEDARRRYALTNRECELLGRVLHGESSAEIAAELSIALATVEWHTKRLLAKTESQNRTQMACRVLGWLPGPN